MSPQKNAQPQKAAVPKTEVSEHEDKLTRKFVFWMVTVTVLIVILGGAAIYWLAGKFVEQSNKNKSQDITIGLLEEKKVDLEALKPNYEKIIADGENGKSDADYILNAMPESQAYDALIAMIERMASETGGKVASISAEDSSDGSADSENSGAQQEYNVVVNFEGSYDQVLDFLRKSEKSSRVMDFVSMTLGGSVGGASNSSSITFTVYYQGPANIEPTEEALK